MELEYLILALILFIGLLIYFKVADHYNIVDNPNQRSSHTIVTLRGGGVVYWMAAAVFLVFNYLQAGWLFFAGLTLIAMVSFYDDIKGTTPSVRLLFHLAAMTLVFYMAGVLTQYPWWALALGYIIFVGIINAWNFMDGINGITGLYSLAVLAGLQYINLVQIPFVNPALIWYPMIASVVFLCFNFRKKARCFAGDVGSVTIAFWTVTLMLMLMIESHSLIWIGFMLVYGVDSVLTILHRLYLRQNVFKAHRLHFYQIMANERKIQHRVVSVIYFVIQLLVSFAIIFLYPKMGWWIFISLSAALVAVYMLKFRLMKIGYATAK
jgi:UDP-N-acetylmuramyl pentapeptide phosphotransferase/UDP-N-acetylglucosamine-1-phosphate transferase